MKEFRERRFLSQDGRSLYYRDYGDPLAAEPLLCLPGLTRNSKDFHSFASRLSVSRRVVCPDYRGRGQSDRDPDPRNYKPMVSIWDMRNLMTAAGLDDIILVGTSFGGFLAMGLGVVSPSSLRAVVLNDVGPDVSEQGMRRISNYIGTDNPQPDWEAAMAQLLQMFPLLAGEPREVLLEEARATWREGADGVLHYDWDTRLAEAVVNVLPETDLWVLFRAVHRFPVLALRGEKSDVLSAETLDHMARTHPDLTALTVPERGHPLKLDDPKVTEALDAFFQRL